MENATCVIPWPLGVAEKCGIKKMWSRCFLMQGPQSSSLGQQLDGMGGGLGTGSKEPLVGLGAFLLLPQEKQ